ncbi:unnamed protein product [Rhizoctonia solani]|uniref:Uncharacterized protein n=1 Tax=Rhizoctonia solani TaxID=456999 RepID=A0A8H2WNQ7_9AGAM|nr:unnamed protein product [Rhizoctonia solani]
MQVTNDHGRGLFADIHHMCTAVFVVRTWLLWGGAKWVLFALIGGLALSSALSIYYISIDLQGFRIIPTVSPQLLPGCLFRVSPTIWRPILFPFLYETFVIALTVTKVMMTPNRVPVPTPRHAFLSLDPDSIQLASVWDVQGWFYRCIVGRMRINPARLPIPHKPG